MKLYLVRRPHPVVDPGVCYGATAGLPGELPVYASPLRRCAVLARRLRPRTLHIDPRLAEMDFGRWEIRPWSAIARAEVDASAVDLLHYRPGCAENVLDVAARVATFLEHLRDSGVPQVLLICHAGTIRLLMQMARGLTPNQAALQATQTSHHIGYGELLMLEV